MSAMKRQQGFTLVELIVVIVLVGIIGGMLSLQLLPSIRSYLLVGQRANLTNQADTALRRIVGDVRGAVPNSLRLGATSCLELVPSKDGGRYRTAPDAALSGTAWLDDTVARNSFDVLTAFDDSPQAGDTIVIGNQNPDDVYSGRFTATVLAAPIAHTDRRLGESRITLDTGAPGSDPNGMRVPPGYDGGRFIVVPAGERVVTYTCIGGGTDAAGTGQGVLYRLTDANFHQSAVCSAPDGTAPAGAAVLATKVEKCVFSYSPNGGPTQESGFAQLQLTLADKGEAVTLTLGAHVDNVP